MNTKQLFLRVCEVCPMEVHEFFTYLGTCVRMLLARYPTALLAAAGDGEIRIPRAFEEACGIDPLYEGALIQGVVAGKTQSQADQNAFLEEADLVYRALWRRAARGKRACAVRG